MKNTFKRSLALAIIFIMTVSTVVVMADNTVASTFFTDFNSMTVNTSGTTQTLSSNTACDIANSYVGHNSFEMVYGRQGKDISDASVKISNPNAAFTAVGTAPNSTNNPVLRKAVYMGANNTDPKIIHMTATISNNDNRTDKIISAKWNNGSDRYPTLLNFKADGTVRLSGISTSVYSYKLYSWYKVDLFWYTNNVVKDGITYGPELYLFINGQYIAKGEVWPGGGAQYVSSGLLRWMQIGYTSANSSGTYLASELLVDDFGLTEYKFTNQGLSYLPPVTTVKEKPMHIDMSSAKAATFYGGNSTVGNSDFKYANTGLSTTGVWVNNFAPVTGKFGKRSTDISLNRDTVAGVEFPYDATNNSDIAYPYLQIPFGKTFTADEKTMIGFNIAVTDNFTNTYIHAKGYDAFGTGQTFELISINKNGTITVAGTPFTIGELKNDKWYRFELEIITGDNATETYNKATLYVNGVKVNPNPVEYSVTATEGNVILQSIWCLRMFTNINMTSATAEANGIVNDPMSFYVDDITGYTNSGTTAPDFTKVINSIDSATVAISQKHATAYISNENMTVSEFLNYTDSGDMTVTVRDSSGYEVAGSSPVLGKYIEANDGNGSVLYYSVDAMDNSIDVRILNGTVTAEVSYSNLGDTPMTAMIVLAQYRNNILVNVAMTNSETVASGEVLELSRSLNDVIAGDITRAMLFKDLSSLIPLMPSTSATAQ